MLCINPGSAGRTGMHKVKTILRFTVEDDKISDMEVIEFGSRGRSFDPVNLVFILITLSSALHPAKEPDEPVARPDHVFIFNLGI